MEKGKPSTLVRMSNDQSANTRSKIEIDVAKQWEDGWQESTQKIDAIEPMLCLCTVKTGKAKDNRRPEKSRKLDPRSAQDQYKDT
jgi:hypothetical protein